MTRKTVFDREKVIEAAFGILRKRGWKAVTVRNIAKALDASTMPLYSAKLSMEDLEWELKARTWQLIQEYQGKPYTPNPLSNLAVGFVKFAQKEPALYRFLYLERPLPGMGGEDEDRKKQFAEAYGKRKDLMRALRQVPDGIQNPLILKSWIFTQGLAAVVAGGQMELTEKKIASLLEEAGGAFYFFEEQLKQGGKQ